ncbi:MAG: hypothetical protein ACK4FA_01080 [Candidatus Paceibacteria bacterium]
MQKIFRHIAHRKSKTERFFWILGIYVLFWCIFYGSYILLPDKYSLYVAKQAGVFMSIYIFVLVPLISFLIPRYVVRHTKIKPWFMYSVHVFMIFLLVLAFFTLSLWQVYNSVGPEDFV